MLAWAIGLAPFKDNYWSTALQPGSSCGKNASEITPSLHNAASTFSAGPVTPGDGVGFSDVAQILRACDSAGLLLHPSRPMTTLDSQIAGDVFGSAAPGRPRGLVQATYSLVSGFAWDHVLGVSLSSDYYVTVGDLTAIRGDIPLRGNPLPPPPGGVVYSLNADTLDISTLSVAPFNSAQPIPFKPCGLSDFQVAHTAPLWANGWALLGDLTKWVPVAEARFSSIVVDAGGVQATLTLNEGETVEVYFYSNNGAKTVAVTCKFSGSNAVTVRVPEGTCA